MRMPFGWGGWGGWGARLARYRSDERCWHRSLSVMVCRELYSASVAPLVPFIAAAGGWPGLLIHFACGGWGRGGQYAPLYMYVVNACLSRLFGYPWCWRSLRECRCAAFFMRRCRSRLLSPCAAPCPPNGVALCFHITTPCHWREMGSWVLGRPRRGGGGLAAIIAFAFLSSSPRSRTPRPVHFLLGVCSSRRGRTSLESMARGRPLAMW